ncbi:ribosome biogenesis protein ytm1 [Tieghemiomyces parasiticus]|uniref:Ribosome biogenesis protein ytm1 n=1 Tax=Tieghemiomyces parasiticus TaxID=78921 RepID=A0A9W7ZXV5_9FUNG|nr:ribosome biogenesis protein ytm1 [Tieghemiomyces parasiticus]
MATDSVLEPTVTLAASFYQPELPVLPPSEFLSLWGKLQSQLARAKMLYCETVTSYYVDFLNIYLYGTDLRNEVAAVSDVFDRLTDSFGRYGSDELDTVAAAVPDVARRLSGTEREIEKLYLLCKVHTQLQDLDGLIEMGEFLPACTAVAEMEGHLAAAAAIREADWDPEVIRTIGDEFSRRRSSLRAHLDDLLAAAVRITRRAQRTTLTTATEITATAAHTYYENPVTIADLWSAYGALGLIAAPVERLVGAVVSDLIQPLLASPGAALTVATHAVGATLTLTSDPGAPVQPTQPTLLQAVASLITIVDFIATHVFHVEAPEGDPTEECATEVADDAADPLGGSDPVGHFAARWWPRVWPTFHDQLLDPLVPKTAVDRAAFADGLVAAALLNLERTLRRRGLLPGRSTPFARFVATLTAHHQRQQRGAALVVARALLLGNDRNTTEVTDATERSAFREGGAGKAPAAKGAKDAPTLHADFRFPTYTVTCTVQALVELIHQTLLDPDPAPTEAYLRARDLIQLFIAVGPLAAAREAREGNPAARAMLLHNDCDYVSRHMVALGHFAKDQWDPALVPVVTFVDFLPPLRRLKRHALTEALCDRIDRWVGRAPSGPPDDAFLEAKERDLRLAVLHVHEWAMASKKFLVVDLHFETLGRLVDRTVDAFVALVTNFIQLTDQTVRQIQLLSRALEDLATPRVWETGRPGEPRIVQVGTYARLYTAYHARRPVSLTVY